MSVATDRQWFESDHHRLQAIVKTAKVILGREQLDTYIYCSGHCPDLCLKGFAKSFSMHLTYLNILLSVLTDCPLSVKNE